MALDLKCRSCGSENTQRLSVMQSQQSYTGLAGQTHLAATLKPPKKPWAYTTGFGFGLVFLVVAGQTQSGWAALLFFIVWGGIGYWIENKYLLERLSWREYLADNFICLRCGNTFDVGAERAEEHQILEEREQLSNRRLGVTSLLAVLGVVSVGFWIYDVENKTPKTQQDNPATPAVQAVKPSVPPKGFRGYKWGDPPGSGLVKKGGQTRDGITMYIPKPGKSLSPLFGVQVAEEAYSFSYGKFWAGHAWFDGADNYERMKTALKQEFGAPTFVNEKLYLWKWKWPGSQIWMQLYYQPKFARTSMDVSNDAM